MKQTATVVLKDGKLMAEVVRTEACGNCRACKFGRQERVHVDLPEGTYREGDQVELQLDDASFSLAAIWAYGVPIAAFFAGLFASRAITGIEWVQALSALGTMGASLLAIHAIERHSKASGRYAQRARACREDGGEYGGNHHTQSGGS